MALRLRGLVALAIAGCTWPGSVFAQGAAEAARDAFSAGLAAESAGRQDEACARFRESLGLVRELGPLQKVAACDERAGKLVSAAALLDEVLARLPASDPDHVSFQDKLQSIRARIGHLRIDVRPGVTGVRARLDGTSIALPAADVPVDPGRRELVVEAPGEPVETIPVDVPPSARVAVTIPSQGAAPVASAAASAPSAVIPAPDEEPSRPLRTTGWILAGVGVAGFVGVAATGIPLLGKSSDFDACPDTACEEGVSDDASGLVALNTVMWGVGIAGVGLGATFLILDAADDGDEASVSATLSPTGATVRGRF